jgi:DNA-binding LacI/PurR family transcriptional regulator
MGEIAAKSLIEQLAGDTKVNPISTLVVRSELIVRGSSLKEKNN